MWRRGRRCLRYRYPRSPPRPLPSQRASGSLGRLRRRLLSLRGPDPDRLDVRELTRTERRELTAVTRALDSAERQARVRCDHAVHEDASGLDAPCETFAERRVARPDGCAEAVRGVVRDADPLFAVTYPNDRRSRAEGLLAEGRHVAGDIHEDGGCEEVALAGPALAAGEATGPGAHRFVDLTLERVEEIAPRERADLCLRVHRIADDEVLNALPEAPLEFFGDGVHNDEPLCGDARLAVVLIPRADCGGRGQMEIRVAEDDERIRSAELEHRLLKRATGELRDARAGFRASSGGDGSDAVVRDDRLDRRAGNQHGAKQALRETRVSESLLDRERALRDVRRVLEHGSVPGHERGSREPDDLPEREVPRHDREHHTERLERDDAPPRVRADLLVGEVARGVLGEMVGAEGAFLDLGLRLDDGLPHLERREPGVTLGALSEECRERAHRNGSFGDGTLAPFEERFVALGEGHLDLVAPERVERRDDFLGRRVHRADLADGRRHIGRG